MSNGRGARLRKTAARYYDGLVEMGHSEASARLLLKEKEEQWAGLLYGSGLSFRQVGEVMGVSPGVARMKYFGWKLRRPVTTEAEREFHVDTLIPRERELALKMMKSKQKIWSWR